MDGPSHKTFQKEIMKYAIINQNTGTLFTGQLYSSEEDAQKRLDELLKGKAIGWSLAIALVDDDGNLAEQKPGESEVKPRPTPPRPSPQGPRSRNQ